MSLSFPNEQKIREDFPKDQRESLKSLLDWMEKQQHLPKTNGKITTLDFAR